MEESKTRYRKYIEEHTDEMLKDISMLCSIESVKGEAEEDQPYGSGPFRALKAAEELCVEYGFYVRNYGNRVITADTGTGAPQLDILAHLDVVPAGDGWTVTEPFRPIIKNGAIYGRGTADDKGPAIAALYAMRAVRELGIGLSKNCRLILGTDEECGSSDIDYYYKIEREAPMTFSPDAEFPVINAEKGQLRGRVSRRLASGNDNTVSDISPNAARRLIWMKSGDTINIVPKNAEAEVSGFDAETIRQAFNNVKAELCTAADILTCEIEAAASNDEGKDRNDRSEEAGMRIRITGTAAHASTPEKGANAGTAMLMLLEKLDFDSRELRTALKEAVRLFPYGDHCGKALGAAGCDEISFTTVSPDIIRIDENEISIMFDARTCINAGEKEAAEGVKSRTAEAGFDMEYTFVPSHAVDKDSGFIKTLLECFEAVTGRKGTCQCVGGGTYVHNLKNGVAFGAVGEETDAHMHGADECMRISELQDAAVIFALAIEKLCR